MGFLNDLFIEAYDGSLKRLLRAVFASKVELNTKQDTINDLSTIRSGAAAGATAVQPSAMNTALANTVAESGVYDVTAKNSGATFASLAALLSAQNLDTLIPVAKRKGGMSIKFVHTSDNKYVQCRYMGTATTGTPNPFLDTDNWREEEDVTIIVAPVNATDATLPITTLTTEIGKYYRIDVAVDTLAVTLPAMTDLTTVRTVVVYLTAGTTPAVTIAAADSKDVYYQDGFEIEAGKTYEINALFNGADWIVAAVKINIE